MEDLGKKIEEAAELKFPHKESGIKEVWINGIYSSEAKEYWQQGIYSEEEVKEMCTKCLEYTNISILGKNFEKWFNKNKRK